MLDVGPPTAPRISEPRGNIPNAVSCAKNTPKEPWGARLSPPVAQRNGGMPHTHLEAWIHSSYSSNVMRGSGSSRR